MKRRRLTDLAGVMDHLAATETHVRSLVKTRRIPFYKVGGRLRFDLDEIDAWLDTNRVEPVA